MTTARHSLMDNRVQLYMRSKSPHWQCACSVGGRQRRTTTKEESLSRAKDVARDWYLGLMGKYREGGLKEGKPFPEAAAKFMDEFEVITQGQRSPIYVKGHKDRIKNHLNPFFKDMVLPEITAGKVQDYRIHRMKNGHRGKPPARSTLHQEIVCLRQILKTANRHGWLDHLPNLSPPYQQSTKITHRAWFSPEEYTTLYTATRERAANPPKKRWRWSCEQLHDFVLFMANTGVRPDEALRLEFRDVEVVEDAATGKTILEIKVRGKRGVGYCKSMPNAVEPFRRLQARKRRTFMVSSDEQMGILKKGVTKVTPTIEWGLPKPTDLVFPKTHRDLFRDILNELDLKFDREGNRRTAYSLRHTYISMRLMEGADIYQIAKNCRTSVEMIEKYYASHIKDRLDAAAINVRKPRRRTKPAAKASPKT
jgi:integrase